MHVMLQIVSDGTREAESGKKRTDWRVEFAM
jgi:hypothetical protein